VVRLQVLTGDIKNLRRPPGKAELDSMAHKPWPGIPSSRSISAPAAVRKKLATVAPSLRERVQPLLKYFGTRRSPKLFPV
jgi:hypothetical protein